MNKKLFVCLSAADDDSQSYYCESSRRGYCRAFDRSRTASACACRLYVGDRTVDHPISIVIDFDGGRYAVFTVGAVCTVLTGRRNTRILSVDKPIAVLTYLDGSHTVVGNNYLLCIRECNRIPAACCRYAYYEIVSTRLDGRTFNSSVGRKSKTFGKFAGKERIADIGITIGFGYYGGVYRAVVFFAFLCRSIFIPCKRIAYA